jgi:transposase InsO family protein
VRELAAQTYDIPNSPHVHLSEQTILRWYHAWKRHGIAALIPKQRLDKGTTKLKPKVQQALLEFKRDNPARSLNTLMSLLTKQGLVASNTLSRAAVHRFLQQHQLSKRSLPNRATIERRSFVAEHAGDLWQGDVLHGPCIQTPSGMRKTYLVSLLDDASRLMAHSAFCFGETALDIEGVLKQALLKRGLPYKLLVDNGAAYRSGSLQSICALLDIKLIYCRPYEPEGKGKLERFHRTFREQFLGEIHLDKITGLDDLNARLWAWLECVYHARPHEGLPDKTPLERWRDDLIHVRPLGLKASHIDDYFYHRFERKVRKDGTVSWEGRSFEVDYELVDKTVHLVVDPHTHTAIRVESSTGVDLGFATPLDVHSNLNRKRQRPHPAPAEAAPTSTADKPNAVELAYDEYKAAYDLPLKPNTQEGDL